MPTVDPSEISAAFPFLPDTILHPGLGDLWRQTLGAAAEVEVLTPTVYAVTQPADQAYPGAISAPNSLTMQFSLRQGALPGRGVYFSGAPLPTDRHLQYLERLEAILA